MKNTNELTTIESPVDAEQQAVEELKALFEPEPNEGPANLPAKTKAKAKSYFFDRFKGKIKVSLS